MFQPTCGRKQESGVWRYFTYEKSNDKSHCLVEGCSVQIKGKYSTNLTNHLKHKHKNIAEELQADNQSKKRSQVLQAQPVIPFPVRIDC